MSTTTTYYGYLNHSLEYVELLEKGEDVILRFFYEEMEHGSLIQLSEKDGNDYYSFEVKNCYVVSEGKFAKDDDDDVLSSLLATVYACICTFKGKCKFGCEDAISRNSMEVIPIYNNMCLNPNKTEQECVDMYNSSRLKIKNPRQLLTRLSDYIVDSCERMKNDKTCANATINKIVYAVKFTIPNLTLNNYNCWNECYVNAQLKYEYEEFFSNGSDLLDINLPAYKVFKENIHSVRRYCGYYGDYSPRTCGYCFNCKDDNNNFGAGFNVEQD